VEAQRRRVRAPARRRRAGRATRLGRSGNEGGVEARQVWVKLVDPVVQGGLD
jgi:hypothetical protein